MEDVIRFQDQFYILATASRAAERTAVLQHADTFALFDLTGDVGVFGIGEQGLYHEGTRYLSRFRLRLHGQRPLLLSARVKEDDAVFSADLTNPDIPLRQDLVLMRDVVHLFRSRFLWEGTWHERIRSWNYGRQPLRLALTFEIEADFADIFEVRGTPRPRRGRRLETIVAGTAMRFGYQGLDGEERWTVIEWSETPTAASAESVRFEYDVSPRSAASLTMQLRCERQRRPAPSRRFEVARAESAAAQKAAQAEYATIETSSEQFNRWLRRSASDLRMLTTETPHGLYPYAGVPWFSTPFGRDGLITALQTLWVNPQLARGVLSYLAAMQATAVDADCDAEPGKILHETRSSEMARLREVPFGQYYGSVDATPLFVVLAGAYVDRTGDTAFGATLWPHVERALAWIDQFGDRDGDGFVEYARHSPTGLVQQGWKDSQDSVFHADGSLAEPPIALCEVQGYVYDARVRAARLADVLGHGERARQLREDAARLRAAFEDRFWCDEEGTYALALDGAKAPCRVRASNAGHCLFGGIVDPARARRTAETLTAESMFSGWGVRTLASVEERYNPMSYHNGSVWPHDNGMLAAGFSRYGFDDLVVLPFAALFDASMAFDHHRLPELFCGFRRRPGEGPTGYPVACSPQAWASGVVFQLVQACLRLSVDAAGRRLTLARSTLPPFLTWLRLLNLALPFGRVDLLFKQHQRDVSVTVLRKQGDFEVNVIK